MCVKRVIVMPYEIAFDLGVIFLKEAAAASKHHRYLVRHHIITSLLCVESNSALFLIKFIIFIVEFPTIQYNLSQQSSLIVITEPARHTLRLMNEFC